MNTNGPKGALAPMTAIAESAVTKGRAVRRGATADAVVPSVNASVCVGIAVDTQSTAGKPVAIAHRPGEIIEVEAGAAFAADALLMSNASAQLITATTGNPVIAVAREAATAAGQLVSAELVGPRILAP